MSKRPRLELVGALLSLIIAALGAWTMRDRIRAVDIVTLFGGGMGAGAGLVAAIIKLRAARKASAA